MKKFIFLAVVLLLTLIVFILFWVYLSSYIDESWRIIKPHYGPFYIALRIFLLSSIIIFFFSPFISTLIAVLKLLRKSVFIWINGSAILMFILGYCMLMLFGEWGFHTAYKFALWFGPMLYIPVVIGLFKGIKFNS